MGKYKIAVGENFVELIEVEADDEDSAIDEALMKSSFNEPEFMEVVSHE